MISELNPGLILIVGALLVPVLSGVVRSVYMLALPVVAFIHVLGLPMGELGQIELFDVTLVTLRVDKLSLVFGYIFLIATLLGVIYALHAGMDDSMLARFASATAAAACMNYPIAGSPPSLEAVTGIAGESFGFGDR